MTSKRQAKRKWERWLKYFARYPWHIATPGMLRAYDQGTQVTTFG